jgi:hypothetical protein
MKRSTTLAILAGLIIAVPAVSAESFGTFSNVAVEYISMIFDLIIGVLIVYELFKIFTSGVPEGGGGGPGFGHGLVDLGKSALNGINDLNNNRKAAGEEKAIAREKANEDKKLERLQNMRMSAEGQALNLVDSMIKNLENLRGIITKFISGISGKPYTEEVRKQNFELIDFVITTLKDVANKGLQLRTQFVNNMTSLGQEQNMERDLLKYDHRIGKIKLPKQAPLNVVKSYSNIITLSTNYKDKLNKLTTNTNREWREALGAMKQTEIDVTRLKTYITKIESIEEKLRAGTQADPKDVLTAILKIVTDMIAEFRKTDDLIQGEFHMNRNDSEKTAEFDSIDRQIEEEFSAVEGYLKEAADKAAKAAQKRKERKSMGPYTSKKSGAKVTLAVEEKGIAVIYQMGSAKALTANIRLEGRKVNDVLGDIQALDMKKKGGMPGLADIVTGSSDILNEIEVRCVDGRASK